MRRGLIIAGGLLLTLALAVLVFARERVARIHPWASVPWLPGRVDLAGGHLGLTYALTGPDGERIHVRVAY